MTNETIIADIDEQRNDTDSIIICLSELNEALDKARAEGRLEVLGKSSTYKMGIKEGRQSQETEDSIRLMKLTEVESVPTTVNTFEVVAAFALMNFEKVKLAKKQAQVRKLLDVCKDAYTPSLFRELEIKIKESFPDCLTKEKEAFPEFFAILKECKNCHVEFAPKEENQEMSDFMNDTLKEFIDYFKKGRDTV